MKNIKAWPLAILIVVVTVLGGATVVAVSAGEPRLKAPTQVAANTAIPATRLSARIHADSVCEDEDDDDAAEHKAGVKGKQPDHDDVDDEGEDDDDCKPAKPRVNPAPPNVR